MKKVLKATFAVAAIGCVCMAVSGCGKEKFNVTQYIEPEYTGYNGYGTVTFEGTYDWIDDIMDWYGDSITAEQRWSSERELKDVVEFEFEPTEGLSNGDTVTVTAKVGKKAEDYAFVLDGTEATFTVEGLEEIEEYDPFADIQVVFEGKAPNGTAKMNNNSDDYTISYEMDKSDGLSNGDTVTVKAAPAYGMKEDEYAQQYGKKLSITEKSFTVEGLASYAKCIDEIPEEMYAKMQKQAEDKIKSHTSGWDGGNSLGKLEFIGNYMLTVKDGFNANPNNVIYYVFKMHANINGYSENDEAKEKKLNEEIYYTYVKFSDIIMLPDGTCSVDISAGEMANNSVRTTHGYYSWGYFERYSVKGYTDLDSMFNDCVTKNIDKYDYENTVE